MNSSMMVGIALFGTGAILLALSIPMLMTHPEFLGYSYLEANNTEVNLLVQLLALGSMLIPFGLVFIHRGRKTNSKLIKDRWQE
jgi:divalent metal cation (Fe/Co/Zn/Cd) transporter